LNGKVGIQGSEGAILLPPPDLQGHRPDPCNNAGQHHHISGKYLGAYAREMAWREDTRRRPNATLHALAAGAALGHPVSRVWKGYWQRGRA
jgi:hypothetical protein